MTLTVKLPEDLERDFELHCKLRRLTKSEVVTKLLAQYLALQAAPKKTPHQLAQELGLVGGFSGPRDLSTNARRYLRKRLREKRHR
jgi:hypothetical protein